LETLTAMASELALSAVYNGRFHHATASWALEEQLASRRCLTTNTTSRKFSTRFDSSRCTLTRRLSSTPSLKNFAYVRSFSDFTEELSKVDSSFSACRASGSTHTTDCASGSTHTTDCTPGNVLSSQSDNSSDGDDDDDDYAESVVIECQEESAAGEWAAALVAVADLSMDNIGRDRSVSESSSSDGSINALSKSPVGFWYVRPGTSLIRCESEDYDDEPICWTASVESTRHTDDSHKSPLGSSGFIGDTHVFSPSGDFVSSNLGKVLAETSLIDCTPTPTTIEICNPSNSADDEFCPLPIDDSLATNGKISYKPLKYTGMNRSMSYSAFITHNRAPMPETSMSSKLNRSTSMAPTQTGDLFRTYFIKFIDLLVQRETEHLVHNKALLKS
jgi:hypothetical protein